MNRSKSDFLEDQFERVVVVYETLLGRDGGGDCLLFLAAELLLDVGLSPDPDWLRLGEQTLGLQGRVQSLHLGLSVQQFFDALHVLLLLAHLPQLQQVLPPGLTLLRLGRTLLASSSTFGPDPEDGVEFGPELGPHASLFSDVEGVVDAFLLEDALVVGEGVVELEGESHEVVEGTGTQVLLALAVEDVLDDVVLLGGGVLVEFELTHLLEDEVLEQHEGVGVLGVDVEGHGQTRA